MLISQAYAQSVPTMSETQEVPVAPDAGEAVMFNIGFIIVIVAMFYLLLIRPQQKRFKEHAEMLNKLQKGDKVVTGGGLVGKIEKITDGNNEVVVDLGGGTKVTAMRSTLQGKSDEKK